MNTKYFNFKNNYSNKDLLQCVNELKNNNIGIFPTDTVYGIGCNCFNTTSIDTLYKVKQRDYNKPINVLVGNIDMVKSLVESINPIEEKLMDVFWPGDLTIIFNKSKIVPDLLTSNLNTIGIRMPNNKICLDLVNNLGTPLATSSANISDKSPATQVNEELISTFKDKISFIIDGGSINTGIPSTIVRVENNTVKILREGSIDHSKIAEVLKYVR